MGHFIDRLADCLLREISVHYDWHPSFLAPALDLKLVDRVRACLLDYRFRFGLKCLSGRSSVELLENMGQVSITLPDGSTKSYESGVTPLEVANSIGKRLAEAAIVAKVDGQLTDLSRPIEKDSSLAILTDKNLEALEVYRHSSAHLLALAVTTLFPETQLGIGPPVENGFYYDFYRKNPFTTEDLEKIEQKMLEFVQQDLPFSRSIHEKSEGLEWFRKQGAELKCELIQEKADKQFSCYTVGTLVDFCLGPHVPSTGKIKAVKLLSIAGAYWKGDEHNKQLQRIYGTAFFSQERTRRLPETVGGGQEARPSTHWQGTRSVQPAGRGRAGSGVLASQRCVDPDGDRRFLARGTFARRI